jgi:DNA-binding NarL/FixJ family response regulator
LEYWEVVQRCLIVDDSQAFLASARALLESQGMTVAGCARSGEEALAIARQAKPELALVDVELAGEDGFVLARSLIAQDPALSVVLISAYELEDVAELVAGCGAAGFISKIGLGRPAIEALVAG